MLGDAFDVTKAASSVGLAGERPNAVQESANKSAASAASPDYVKFQAVIKSAASAASLRGGRASGRLDHGLFFAFFGRASGQKITKNSQNLGLCLQKWVLSKSQKFQNGFVDPPSPVFATTPAKKDGKCFFFQHGFFKPYGPNKGNVSFIASRFFRPLFHIFGR